MEGGRSQINSNQLLSPSTMFTRSVVSKRFFVKTAQRLCSTTKDEDKFISKTALIDKITALLETQGPPGSISKKKVTSFVSAFTDVITKEVIENGKEIRLNSFGTFKMKFIPARVRRNPRTGKNVECAEKRKLTFKASSALSKPPATPEL
eukprot:gene153-163_t